MEFIDTHIQIIGMTLFGISLIIIFGSIFLLLKSTDKDLERIQELKEQGLL